MVVSPAAVTHVADLNHYVLVDLRSAAALGGQLFRGSGLLRVQRLIPEEVAEDLLLASPAAALPKVDLPLSVLLLGGEGGRSGGRLGLLLLLGLLGRGRGLSV